MLHQQYEYNYQEGDNKRTYKRREYEFVDLLHVQFKRTNLVPIILLEWNKVVLDSYLLVAGSR